MAGVIFAAIQTGNVVWASVIITTICVGATYYVKNYLVPSLSSNASEGQLGWKNILSAVILAVLTAIGDSVSNLVINGAVNWGLMWSTVISVVATYLGASLFTGQPIKK